MAGRAHRDGQRRAVDADLERLLDGDLVADAVVLDDARLRASCTGQRAASSSPLPPIGRTSTATTLYSGHDVLTSAEEPISRFVRVSGKWNVVKTWPGSIRSVTCAAISIRPCAAAHGDRVAVGDPQPRGVVGVDLQ